MAVACLQFLIGPFLVAEGKRASQRIGRTWATISLAALAAALWLWYSTRSPESPFLSPALFRERFARRVFPRRGDPRGNRAGADQLGHIVDDFAAEFHGLLLLIVAGVSLTAAANDLIVLFLALELVSIPTYVFLYLPRREAGGPEATTKYFLLSIFSSAIVLYGFSFLYGAVGSTHLGTIHQALGPAIPAATERPRSC